jgi:hypothetical protein
VSIASTIARLATDHGVVVSRRVHGTYVNGIYTQATPTTFTIDCVTEPAFNLNRVIGGANMVGRVDGEMTTDVRQIWTTTELYTQSDTNDPDEMVLQGHTWTVARVERWDLRGQVHFHVVLTAKTLGASPQ